MKLFRVTSIAISKRSVPVRKSFASRERCLKPSCRGKSTLKMRRIARNVRKIEFKLRHNWMKSSENL